MAAFHEAHFSQLATDHFHTHFLRPDDPPAQETTYNAADEDEYYEEEDDGLGYYPDGVKRTLTDEQIAIFRHSEFEALRRARGSSQPRKSTTTNPEEDSSEEGEISSTPSGAAKKSKKRKRGKPKNNNKNRTGGEPIDLRKRTWDVVDTGLASLDYGEEENNPAESSAIQRRRISYDD
jgi:hypothetical protein